MCRKPDQSRIKSRPNLAGSIKFISAFSQCNLQFTREHMTEIITVESVAKAYYIGTKEDSSDSLAGAIINIIKSPLRKWNDLRKLNTFDQKHESKNDIYWALKNVSFTVRQGDVLGIIGGNGAGKSTLLKILSRITEPTRGKVKIFGRVSSLLEVGTGFHPDLSGRENIYLNGTILGMTKKEIDLKFDEIVEFSGVERFLDTPIKRYSSGMKVRLAFAVAAHLEPEILIIDEVLAVGDAEFQRKCLGKMKDVATQGRTVLFVSHEMNMVASLCNRTIVLDKGEISFDGDASEGVLAYQRMLGISCETSIDSPRASLAVGDDSARLKAAWLENTSGARTRTFDINDAIIISMDFEIMSEQRSPPYVNFHLFDRDSNYICVLQNRDYGCDGQKVLGVYRARCSIPGGLLNTGTFSIGIAVTCTDYGPTVSYFERNALCFNVIEDLDITLNESRCGFAGVFPGVIRPQVQWEISKANFTV